MTITKVSGITAEQAQGITDGGGITYVGNIIEPEPDIPLENLAVYYNPTYSGAWIDDAGSHIAAVDFSGNGNNLEATISSISDGTINSIPAMYFSASNAAQSANPMPDVNGAFDIFFVVNTRPSVTRFLFSIGDFEVTKGLTFTPAPIANNNLVINYTPATGTGSATYTNDMIHIRVSADGVVEWAQNGGAYAELFDNGSPVGWADESLIFDESGSRVGAFAVYTAAVPTEDANNIIAYMKTLYGIA